MKQPLSLLPAAFAALALAAAPARAVSPQGAFDTCTGGVGFIHVTGWAYDPDVSSQSTDVMVSLYTDSACTSLYDYSTLAANVSRPDVNQAKGITGNHGFDANIPAPAGTYWVTIMGIDKTGDYNMQFSPTRSATVLPVLPGSGTASDPYRISSVAEWNSFAANINAGTAASARYRLDADIGPVTRTVGTEDSPFRGIFDGGSNTLTVALSGSDRSIAPFSRISGATIRNLKVAGTVSGAMHCSGLVGEVGGSPNLIESCEVLAAISSSASHFGGFIGHSVTYAVTLRGCVFSGSLSGGTYVATFNGWSDDGAATTLIDCFDASASVQPIGRGDDAVCVSNTYYLASKSFSNGERLWSEGKRGKQVYDVTAGEGVTIDFGAPAATYGTAGIVAYATGMARNGTFYAGQGDVVRMGLDVALPSGMVMDAYAVSAGTLSRTGGAWTLTMPAESVVVSANWAAPATRGMVRLWAGGPFWAETNVGADEPWESGLYFWWGDTLGYRRENDTWVARDGFSSGFSFEGGNAPTYGKNFATLQSEGWITADGVLAPAYDAAQERWGGGWHMPTQQDLSDLAGNCDWTWTTTNGVSGYVVRGRGNYASNAIFLPCAGYGHSTSLSDAGSHGGIRSSDFPGTVLEFDSNRHGMGYIQDHCCLGFSVRPIQILPAEVTISFAANDGSMSLSSQIYTPGEAYGTLPTPTREGHVFAGWFTEATGGTQVTTASTAPVSATTLYAHWTSDGPRNKVQLWEDGPFWAEMNVGADEVWDYGLYFWWGDTVGYRRQENAWVASDGSSSSFSFDFGCAPTYDKYPTTLQSEGWITSGGVLAPAHDAAHAHWDGDWRMPTIQELEALCENCDWTRTTTNGVSGYLVRGRGTFAGASIFLPAAGGGFRTSLNNAGQDGYYWSSAPLAGNSGNAKYLAFYTGDHETADTYRFRGQPVRAVQSPPPVVAISFDPNDGSESLSSRTYTPGEAYGTLPTPSAREGREFVGWFTEATGGTQVTTASTAPESATTLYAHWTSDGTRNKVQLWEGGPCWAEMNVGADEVWDYGLYFWWGDTVGYRRQGNAWVASDGSSSSFSFDSGCAPTYDKFPATLQNEGWMTSGGVLAPAHDAVQAHWDGAWRMPTIQELQGLCDNCDWTRTTTNGVSGYVVRGRGSFAGASIFLPAAGCGSGTSLNNAGLDGCYWSSVPLAGNSGDAKYLAAYSDDHGTADIYRFRGQPVRPVWPTRDLSAMTADYTAEDGDVLTGTTTHGVSIPAGATVIINGVSVTGLGGGAVNPAPAFAAGGEAVTTKFVQGSGGTWTLTTFAELDNDALGKDVEDRQIKVYAAETVEGLGSASPLASGVTVTDKKSAVKVSLEVETQPGDDSQFFRVGFGE